MAEPDTASKSSGGLVTARKLRKDFARLKREGPKVINLLRELARLARKNTTKGANYPEMD